MVRVRTIIGCELKERILALELVAYKLACTVNVRASIIENFTEIGELEAGMEDYRSNDSYQC